MTLVVASLPIRKEDDIQRIPSFYDADLIEIRLDYLGKLIPIERLEKFKEKIIITIRDPSEGGVNLINPKDKAEYLGKLDERGFLYDVEARFAKMYKVSTKNKIVSVHYFDRVPSFEEVYEIIRDFIETSWLVKVAVIGKPGYRSLLSKILELGKVTVMPMGVDPLERIAFSILGSQLIYGHTGEETAKGQMHYKIARQVLSYLTSISTSSPSILTG